MSERAETDRVALWFYVDDVDAAFAAFLARRRERPSGSPPTCRGANGSHRARDPDGNLVNLGAQPA